MIRPLAARTWRLSLGLIALLFVVAARPAVAAEAQPAVTYNRDVRPILSDKCFFCHGPDHSHREADLRLDMPDQAMGERESGRALVPGKPDESLVWKRIISDDPDERMPPAESHKELTTDDKETLRRWIEQGAKYQKHWAFEPPVVTPEPAVSNAKWPRNPIDRFILARLDEEKLRPQPEANRETLVRRVAFALTGLPPTVAEVDQFLGDESPDAYEKMVDRYLASPRFGEEQARSWLDVARYADTHGLHLDNEREMWAYRDWVVKALNQNMPFDRFTVWQLAGDQLPNATPEQLTATGFNRCNVTTSEGGAIAEEFLYRYAVDRASTTIQAWMGLTGGCAVCHDHKYDPLTTKEFYSFYAFFNSAADPGMDKNIRNTEPFYELPTAKQKIGLEASIQREAESLKQLEALVAKSDYTDPADAKPPAEAREIRDVVFDDAFPLGMAVKSKSRNASTWLTDPKFGAPAGRRVLRQASSQLYEDTITSELRPIMINADSRCEVWVRIDPKDVPEAVAITINARGGTRRVSWGNEDAFGEGKKELAKDVLAGPLPPAGKWTKLSINLKELGLQPNFPLVSIALQQFGGVVCWDELVVVGTSKPQSDPLASLAVWLKRLANKAPAEVPEKLRAAINDAKHDWKPEERKQLEAFYLAKVARPANDELAAVRRDWEHARAEHQSIDESIVGTFIFRDLEQPRPAFIMVRGQYDKPGDPVEPAVPAIFPKLKKADSAKRATRLDLARWLVSPEHPLMARVQANRIWQQLFGIGLVKTSYDFGAQGEPPSHPELLDWLAIEFRNRNWDVKYLVKLMVTSATFRQQSLVTPVLRRRDPENRLLARGPRFRLDAEQIRDNALATSGLLNLTMGGRGVNPYQPPDIWEPVGYSDSNTRYYLQDHGPSLYRRSLYTFLKRTAPPPFMTNFDGPNREQFCIRRERSNTPLQALQLMNDIQQFEAARALAERAIAGGGSSPDERIEFLYRTVLARRPEAEEANVVRRAFETQLKLFQGDPAAAAKAIRVGESKPKQVAPDVEIAAWTLVANLVLNLDETLCRN